MGTIGTDIELESCGVTTFETDLPQPLLLGFGDPLQRAGDTAAQSSCLASSLCRHKGWTRHAGWKVSSEAS